MAASGAGEIRNAGGGPIRVHLRAVGATPQLKKAKFKAPSTETWALIVNVLRKSLKVADSEPVYAYLRSSFCPDASANLGGLHQCFASGGELVVQYSLKPAYQAA